MKLNGKVLKVSLILVVLIAGLVIASVVWHGKTFNKNMSSNWGLSLTSPAFAQTGELPKFPVNEAGISAYVNVGQNIDITKAKGAFIGITGEGNDYVIGTVKLYDLPERTYPHVYVNQSGWILAYYTKLSPSSLIMPWNTYKGGALLNTTFREAISTVCAAVNIAFILLEGKIGYYNFQYPEATKMLLVVGMNTPSFNYMIPVDVILFEASWSKKNGGNLSINGKTYTYCSNSYESGKLTNTYLTLGEKYVTESGGGLAITFIYK